MAQSLKYYYYLALYKKLANTLLHYMYLFKKYIIIQLHESKEDRKKVVFISTFRKIFDLHSRIVLPHLIFINLLVFVIVISHINYNEQFVGRNILLL